MVFLLNSRSWFSMILLQVVCSAWSHASPRVWPVSRSEHWLTNASNSLCVRLLGHQQRSESWKSCFASLKLWWPAQCGSIYWQKNDNKAIQYLGEMFQNYGTDLLQWLLKIKAEYLLSHRVSPSCSWLSNSCC